MVGDVASSFSFSISYQLDTNVDSIRGEKKMEVAYVRVHVI